MVENQEININKKVVLVTGASRGIGRAISKFLSKDYIVIANYNKSENKANSLKQECDNLEIYKADVSKREEIKAMIEYILNRYGKIDVLVNNAGIDQEKMFQDITDEDWNKVINVNLYSVFCVSQEVIGNMISRKEGCIINISSIYGTNGGACAVAYSATKAGIDGITKSLAKELGPSNIRVNSVAPGCINTDMNSYLTEQDWNLIKEETPLGTIGEGIDIAKCVKWLVEDKFTTGQVISINGGIVI